MKTSSLKKLIPQRVFEELEGKGFEELRPCQYKAVKAGLFEDKNLVVCTPTASGKTLVAELAFLNAVLHDEGKAVYLVPLKALAYEKFKDFKKEYPDLRIALSSGDMDSDDAYLKRYDVIISTVEKFDSLIRHRAPWLREVKVLVVDEVHLLNDLGRGPTLEVVITLTRRLVKRLQVIALSATIGNPEELAGWLDAELVLDDWRPVELRKGVSVDGNLEFYK